MTSNPIHRTILAAALALPLFACQQKPAETTASTGTTTETNTVASSPDAARHTITTTTTTTSVTVDPVEANQYNAGRRRARTTTSTSTSRSGENAGSSEARRGPALRGSHEVPAGTILRVKFDRGVSTATARVGDTVSGDLLDDLLADDDTVVAPSGSRVRGKVEHVVDSGKLARPAELRFRLTDLEIGGRSVPLATSAYQRTGDTHTKRNAGYIAGGAAVGAILGQVFGRDTQATLEGAAAGAAAGTGAAALTGDLDFEIEAGRPIAFTLEQPLRLPASR